MPAAGAEKVIHVRSSVEAIRRRPGLYLGPSDGVPLANLALREAFCLSRDAAARGCCKEITITLRAGGEALIHDDGPGLPLDRDADGLTWAERAFTVLRACAEAKPKELAKTTCALGLVVLTAVIVKFDPPRLPDDAPSAPPRLSMSPHASARRDQPSVALRRDHESNLTITAVTMTCCRASRPSGACPLWAKTSRSTATPC